jgi:hypothetical protein
MRQGKQFTDLQKRLPKPHAEIPIYEGTFQRTTPFANPTLERGDSMSTKQTILYSRLSREDERANESLSIENQKAFLGL